LFRTHHMKIDDIHPQVLKFLYRKCFRASYKTQTANGVKFNLTFEDFMDAIFKNIGAIENISEKYLNMRRAGRIREYKTTYVLGWVSKDAYETKIMDPTTCCWIYEQDSWKMFQMRTGGKHSDKSKRAISLARTGIHLTAEHKAALSKSLTGKPKSEETKQKMRATQLRKHEAKRAAQVVAVAA
jgi:hypothetical protein